MCHKSNNSPQVPSIRAFNTFASADLTYRDLLCKMKKLSYVLTEISNILTSIHEVLEFLRTAFCCLYFIPALEKLWAIFNFIEIFPTGFYIHINLKQIICFPALKNEILPSGLAINT